MNSIGGKKKILNMISNLSEMVGRAYIVNRKGYEDKANIYLAFEIIIDEIKKM